ncbi:MAG TPA: hypothetical protein VFP65_29915 [Anaeromyxobacteraceae bacterium]|nr:hypothetical protein [Anaeromyxobacteraceae bacterium]
MADATAVPAEQPRKYPRGAFKRAAGMLALASVLAALCAAAVFAFVARADFLTGAAGALSRFLFDHAWLAVAAAVSPIFAALLVGFGYMQRGIARRAAMKAAAAARGLPLPPRRT